MCFLVNALVLLLMVGLLARGCDEKEIPTDGNSDEVKVEEIELFARFVDLLRDYTITGRLRYSSRFYIKLKTEEL